MLPGRIDGDDQDTPVSQPVQCEELKTLKGVHSLLFKGWILLAQMGTGRFILVKELAFLYRALGST